MLDFSKRKYQGINLPAPPPLLLAVKSASRTTHTRLRLRQETAPQRTAGTGGSAGRGGGSAGNGGAWFLQIGKMKNDGSTALNSFARRFADKSLSIVREGALRAPYGPYVLYEICCGVLSTVGMKIGVNP